MSAVQVFEGYIPGSIGRVVELHGNYYSKNWNFGVFFESKIARELSEFIDHYDDSRDGFWNALVDGKIEGSITIDGINSTFEGAHLRWFIVSDLLRGSGVGNQLFCNAIDFCKNNGYERIYLWTFAGLDAARHIYEKYGFKLIEEAGDEGWGTRVNAQKFELLL